jgi:hypothetical protein
MDEFGEFMSNIGHSHRQEVPAKNAQADSHPIHEADLILAGHLKPVADG